MSTVTLLHVDGVDEDREAVRDRFADRPHVSVTSRASAEGVVSLVESRAVDCLVTAFELPERTGLALIDEVRAVAPDVSCILYTAADRSEIRAHTTGSVSAYVPKDSPHALSRLERLVETSATLRTQTAYPVPSSEPERLQAIEGYDLTNDALAEAVDRITEAAARHFDVTVAAVGIVGEQTEEFLGCYGSDLPTMDRQDTICTYTILDDDVTVIEDLERDGRFSSNELLESSGIRFYAGAVVRSEDDLPIGTLCVYDEQPREFSNADETYLELLSDEVGAWIGQVGRPAETAPMEVSGE